MSSTACAARSCRTCCFPIGGYRKEEVRSLARRADLGVADKPDSVEICFVPDGDHAALIRQRRPDTPRRATSSIPPARSWREHDGIEQFTIGQRKGLGFAAGRAALCAAHRARRERGRGRRPRGVAGVGAAGVGRQLACATPPPARCCQAKIRYRHTAAAATVTPLGDGRARVVFDEPQSAVTPGQAVVFYDGSRVLGGGWIEQALAE